MKAVSMYWGYIAGEFIKDTEEYINIELDSSRNRLIRLEIVLTAGTFAVAIFSLVAGELSNPIVCPSARAPYICLVRLNAHFGPYMITKYLLVLPPESHFFWAERA